MKTEFGTDLFRLKYKLFFGRVFALRILVGLIQTTQKNPKNGTKTKY